MSPFDTLEHDETAEAEAAWALGRLDGALRHLPDLPQRLLAARLLRETLIAALRQEGHAVTPARFHAWLAGLVPLADASEPTYLALRPPRALILALLTALSHARWAPLATLAVQFTPAVLALPDTGSDPGQRDAHDLLAQARALLDQRDPSSAPLPFAWLATLHHAMAEHATFAPAERGPAPIGPKAWRVTAERAPTPSPRWALEAQLGDRFQAAGWLHHALPLTGLVRLDALQAAGEDAAARAVRATALRDVAVGLSQRLDDACSLAQQVERLRQDRRNTSRAPALFELLAGFGALRTAQLETLLGATRLGVRKMLVALQASGMLTRSMLAGVVLYDSASDQPQTIPRSSSALAVSPATLSDYDAAMAYADALLARSNLSSDDDDV